MNALLTWWGVSIAVVNHETLGNAVIPRETLLRVVPVFVALIVWLIRVLIIGTFSIAGERLFSQADAMTTHSYATRSSTQRAAKPATSYRRAPSAQTATQTSFRPVSKQNRPEPTYHPVSMKSRSNDKDYLG
jgi:hypothetical protein